MQIVNGDNRYDDENTVSGKVSPLDASASVIASVMNLCFSGGSL